MVARAETGERVDCGEGPFGLAEMRAWPEERTVRAAVLRHLLVGEQWPVDAKGVRLRGVRINGLLDLDAATLRCPLMLDWCYLDADEPACLSFANASRVSLTRCQLAGLTGDKLTAKELNLSGSTFTGPLQLPGADISGQLSCTGAQLNGRDNDGNALVARNMKTGGAVLLDGDFTAAGSVQLLDADIRGQLVCSGAQLNGEGNALVADNMKTGGTVFLDERFTAAGSVRLGGADISGDFACSGAQLNGEGNALVADNMKTGGTVFLDERFTAAGSVRLGGADISGDFACSGAQLNGEGNALVADNMKTGGTVFLDDGFTAAGSVRLVGADISGDFVCSGAQLNGGGNALVADNMKTGRDVVIDTRLTAAGTISLNSAHVGGAMMLAPEALAGAQKVALTAVGANIKGKLQWAPERQISGRVNLEAANVGELEDDWTGKRAQANGYWPTDGRLHLDGFTYDRFGGDQQATVERRLDWIRSQYTRSGTHWTGFATQPYQQLADVYRRAGKDAEARKVAIAKRVDLRRYGNLHPYRKVGNWLLDKTIRYGYESWRAGAGLAVLYSAVWLLVTIAQHTHGIMPVGNIKGLDPVPSATTCTSNYPCFAPAGYAVDVVIPIINVHQDQYWGPNGHAWGYAWVTSIWMVSVLGWALATLLVAGLTGLTRRQD